jgi:hypothetical protein
MGIASTFVSSCELTYLRHSSTLLSSNLITAALDLTRQDLHYGTVVAEMSDYLFLFDWVTIAEL